MNDSDKIDELRKYETELWDIYAATEEKLLGFTKEYIPLSGFLLISMLRRLSRIQIAILDACESVNYYSLNILYRSFIEHYLKFLYTFMRLAEEKNDDVGKDYYVHGMLNEFQLMRRSVIKAETLTGENKVKQPQDKQIEDKFKFNKIIRYINSKIPAKNCNELPLNLIPMYSRLSSFVHCGVIADIDDLFSDEPNMKKFTEILDVSFLMFSGAFLQTFDAFDGLHRHLKGEINTTFAEQRQKLSNIYYEIQSKLNTKNRDIGAVEKAPQLPFFDRPP
jgi:hypothetical protein